MHQWFTVIKMKGRPKFKGVRNEWNILSIFPSRIFPCLWCLSRTQKWKVALFILLTAVLSFFPGGREGRRERETQTDRQNWGWLCETHWAAYNSFPCICVTGVIPLYAGLFSQSACSKTVESDHCGMPEKSPPKMVKSRIQPDLICYSVSECCFIHFYYKVSRDWTYSVGELDLPK